jgi:hypothetical protein
MTKPSVAAPTGGAMNGSSTPGTTTSSNPASNPTTPGMNPPPATNPMTMGTAGVPGMTMMPPGPMTPAAGSGAPAMPPPPRDPSLPDDGDPSKPMVEIPGVPCGVPKAGFGATPPTVKITDRDVVVAYPCAHEGAAVTFFLFLHGTVDEPIKVSFTMNAWPIHELVDSHNIIVVAPKAIGTQWGNGDDGKDLPHLYDVVDWVYDTFGEKFDIRSMWAQGGSWGAFYLSTTFACDPKFEGRLKGVQLIVGGGCPACSNRLSCMVGQQELEKGGGMTVSDDMKEMLSSGANIDPYAKTHGCDAKMGPTNLGPVRYWQWPNCDPGWIHSYYLGPGNHADAWDRAAVLRATEEIKSTEK